MGQKFFEDSIGTLTQSSGIITLGTSSITIGGQQYQVSSATYTLSGLVASTKYYLYAVVSGGVLTLVPSTNVITVGPAGYTSWKFIRAFTTNSSAGFGAFSGMISDPNPVGTIIHSMLTLAQFQSIYGTNWVLADGSATTNSMYSLITGNNNVPDMRGMTLRGKNNGRADGNQNPDGDSQLGTYQADMYGRHTHPTYLEPSITQTGGYFAAWRASNVNGWTDITSNGGGPQNSGGNETRMKNITVNIFIKINMD